MTKLVVLRDDDPAAVSYATTDGAEIAVRLGERGVRFERWDVRPLADGADALELYRSEVDRLCRAEGYVTVDVARLRHDAADPDGPAKAAEARKRFLDEHTHDDDEVRFFVDGRGAFYLRLDGAHDGERGDATDEDGVGEVTIVVCEAGDLISVPKDTRHWFDMGTAPNFAAIRFFRVPEGWVGRFTGDPISSRFPTFDELVTPAAT
jgi:1,2-dihydroxy-3-keto-5-methylthiopentene dioxygenase